MPVDEKQFGLIDKILKYLRSDFKNVFILLLLVVIYVKDERERLKDDKIDKLQSTIIELHEEDARQAKMRTNEVMEAARVYRDLNLYQQQFAQTYGIKNIRNIDTAGAASND